MGIAVQSYIPACAIDFAKKLATLECPEALYIVGEAMEVFS